MISDGKMWTVENGPVKVSAHTGFAGAISSLKWNGKEFVNSSDHGRLLQSACQLNGHIECFNPTQAGNRDRTPSKLVSASVDGYVYKSSCKMAYWLPPGECSEHCKDNLPGCAINDTVISGVTHTQRVTVRRTFLHHLISFTLPEDYDQVVFETLTGYMPEEFCRFWSLDSAGNKTEIGEGPGGGNNVILVSTQDEKFATGSYCPFPGTRYNRWWFRNEKVTKWNCAHRYPEGLSAGKYTFAVYTVFGTLESCHKTVLRLREKYS